VLQRATHTRSDREAAKGKQSGHTQFQRLIGRSLRAVFDLKKLGDVHCIWIAMSCNRWRNPNSQHTARHLHRSARCGGFLIKSGKLDESPIHESGYSNLSGFIGRPSTALLEFEYTEDSVCDTDMNVVMTGEGHFIEVQGTAEGAAFTHTNELLTGFGSKRST
jgi:ribonuclease PH